MTTPAYVDGIEVMWRPGCPFCMKLRGALKLRGVTTTEVDIWSTPEAAARVRDVADGNETVPTVFIGSRALVNPSVQQVIATVEQELPDRAGDLLGSKGGLWRRLFGSARKN